MPQMEVSNCLLIFGVVIIIAVTGMFMYMYKCSDGFTNIHKIKESFSPTGWTASSPPPSPTSDIIGQCGPGCYYKCSDTKNCPNINVKNYGKKDRAPILRDNLPIGWGDTMTGPYAGPEGCSSNINGINRNSYMNPYGELGNDQMYSFCEKGVTNPFTNQDSM